MTLKNNILGFLLMVLTIGLAYFFWLLTKPDIAGDDIGQKFDNRTVNIAVAANYKKILSNSIDKYLSDNQITKYFTINVISGSTGALFTQIKNGAPFDLFLAADMERPQTLVQSNLTIEDKPFIYTTGTLAISYQSTGGKEFNCGDNNLDQGQLDQLIDNLLKEGEGSKTIVIANPITAPYGKAAEKLLEKLKSIGKENRVKIIRGKDIIHAQQILLSGHADIAFLASHMEEGINKTGVSYCSIDQSLYPPIEQGMVSIKSKEMNNPRQLIINQIITHIKKISDKI